MVTQNGKPTGEETLELGGSADTGAGLDSLRMKLKRNTVPIEAPEPPEDNEPSHAQLVATGEVEEEPEEPGEAGEEEKPPTALVVKEDEGIKFSVRKRVEQGIAEGKTKKELVAEGLNERSVDTIVSQLKARAQRQVVGGKPSARTSSGMPIFAHGSPPEAIIESVRVPDVANGEGVPFEQGIKFGMSLVILGVRVAQELSGIGITQAKPILDMAKSMREGEAMAAKNAAEDAAMEAAGMVRDSMMPMLANIQRGGGGEGGDPVKKMMVDVMQPIIQKLMGGVMGRLVPGQQVPQLTEGSSGAGSVDGWTHRSEE